MYTCICISIVVAFYPGFQMAMMRMVMVQTCTTPTCMNHRIKLQHFKIDSKTTSSAFLKSRTSKQVIILYIKTQSKGLALNIATSGTKLFIYKSNGK